MGKWKGEEGRRRGEVGVKGKGGEGGGGRISS